MFFIITAIAYLMFQGFGMSMFPSFISGLIVADLFVMVLPEKE